MGSLSAVTVTANRACSPSLEVQSRWSGTTITLTVAARRATPGGTGAMGVLAGAAGVSARAKQPAAQRARRAPDRIRVIFMGVLGRGPEPGSPLGGSAAPPGGEGGNREVFPAPIP